MSVALSFHRSLHKRPGGWTPKALGTLDLWLDADDATTITVATGVSQWNDKSGNGRHVSQSTGANQPTLVPNAQNGRAVLRFDGLNDVLNGGDVLDLDSGNLSVAYGSVSTAGILLSKQASGVSENGEWQVDRGAAFVFLGGTLVETGTRWSTPTVSAWVLDRSSGSTVYANGTQNEADTGSPFPNTVSYNTTHNLLLGSRTTPSTASWLNGDVYEVIVSRSAWTTADRQQVEGYLAHKWGLTASLPSDHPYKNSAP